MKRKIIGILLAAVCSSAHASPFRIVEGNRDVLIDHDIGSRVQRGNIVHMWTYYKFPAPIHTDNRKYDSVMFLVEYNCENRSSRISKHIDYLGENVVYSSANSEWSDWSEVAPQSRDEDELMRACGFKPYALDTDFKTLEETVTAWQAWRASQSK